MLLCLLHSLKLAECLQSSIVTKLVVPYQNLILRTGSRGQFSAPGGSSFAENVMFLGSENNNLELKSLENFTSVWLTELG